MRFVKLAALLAALALVIAACGEDDNGADDGGEDVSAEQPGDQAEQDDRGADLDDDVAAVVNGQDIPADGIDEQVEAFADDPAIAEQFEGLSDDEMTSLISSQVLTNAIVTVVAVGAAEELGAPVTDEDLAVARSELEEETGGAEALAETLEQEGVSEDRLDDQLRALAALRNIEATLEEDAGDGEEEAPEVEGAPSPSAQRAQQFVSERLANADVIVNDDYGSWDPQTGQVTPPGGVPDLTPTQPEVES